MVFFGAMKRCTWLFLALFSPLAWAASGHLLTAEEWSRPRSGESLRQLPALQAAVHEFMGQPGADMVIRYPGGEDGVIWVQELRSWLIALGIPSQRIVTLPGSGRLDVLDIRVTPAQ